jgi:hypothetical protein
MSAASEAGRSNRILRVAIAASLLVHLVLGLLFVLTEHELDRLLHVDRPHVRPTPPSDEIVTISSALHIEKRAKPVPVQASARSAARRPQTARHARTAPAPQQVAAVPRAAVAAPSGRAASRLRHELASETNAATAPPQTSPEKTVARVERPAAAARPAPASRSNKLSDAQLAKIEHDLAKTIAQSRAQADPLRVKPEAPAAPKSYRLQMHGVFGNLHRGQGQYYPVRGWHADGVDWYYVSYEFTYADGTYETGNVPWPIHFTPGSDPFVNGLTNVQLPGPPPGFVPPGTLGKALRAYFPSLVFSNSDN